MSQTRRDDPAATSHHAVNLVSASRGLAATDKRVVTSRIESSQVAAEVVKVAHDATAPGALPTASPHNH